MTAPRTAWLAFLVLGVLDGVVLLSIPSVGVVIAGLGLAGIAIRPPRLAAFAGLASGVGAIWTFLLLRAKLGCEGVNRRPGQSCEAPGIEGWILVGLAILAIGLVASAFVVLRRMPPRDDRGENSVMATATHRPSATPTATNSGLPQSMSTSHEATRCTCGPTLNSKTSSWPSNAILHVPVNGCDFKAVQSVASIAAARVAIAWPSTWPRSFGGLAAA